MLHCLIDILQATKVELIVDDLKPIPGFPHYFVDKNGNVWSQYKGGRNGLRDVPRKLKPTLNRIGYLQVNLRNNGKQHTKQVHRLIYEAFKGTIPAGMHVHHVNGNKTDNRLCNLELMSKEEHDNHHLDDRRKGIREKQASLSPLQVIAIVADRVRTGDGAVKIGRRHDVHYGIVNEIFRGRNYRDISQPLFRLFLPKVEFEIVYSKRFCQ